MHNILCECFLFRRPELAILAIPCFYWLFSTNTSTFFSKLSLFFQQNHG